MTVFLTLGDGDFSYSLDLVRFLASSTVKNTIVVTGVDSLQDMKEKYKDIDFILNRLQKSVSDTLGVIIQHEVNAVSSSDDRPIAADVVIFNHPHLGTEDAARHGRFLHHFLHECSKSWLTNDAGAVHLTLAAGQWERWKGAEAATKQGYFLKHRLPFSTPPVDAAKYQHRRHQTGKSFHSRTMGSETFVLTRQEAVEAFVFGWQKGENVVKQQSKPAFECTSCERSFREERSLKSHIKAVHGEGSKKRKRDIQCHQCASTGIVKIFAHEQSLNAHIQAKHGGLHTNIKPEWADKRKEEDEVTVSHGACEICGFVYKEANDVILHGKEFLPGDTVTPSETYTCQFCEKAFQSQRAQLQHENVCAQRQR